MVTKYPLIIDTKVLELSIYTIFPKYKLSVNEKLPALKFQYFGKNIIQIFGYCYVHVSDQQQTGLEI